MTLLLGEEAVSIGDDQAKVSEAGLIDAGVVNLVEDAVAERKPDAAGGAERCPYAALGTERPAWRDARSPGRRLLVLHCFHFLRISVTS